LGLAKDAITTLESRKYSGMRALAELPYFELTGDGLLRLKLDDLGPGIDGHTHFAGNSLAGPKPDLSIRHPATKYYLATDSPFLMTNYMGQNDSEQDVANIMQNLLGMLTPEGSPFAKTHTIPNLIAEMDLLGIEKAVVLPISYGMPYGDDMTEWYADAIEKSGKASRFILCGAVKPTLPGAAERVRNLKLMGVKGIKIHPNMALFKPNDPLAWACYQQCSDLGLPVLAHSGLVGKEVDDPSKFMGYTGLHADMHNFIEPIAAFPDMRLVLCHAGGLQNDMAADLAHKNKNIWLDIQGQSVGNIRNMIKMAGPEKLMFGTDWPFFPEATLLARLLLATEGDKKVRRMLYYENAARFWGISI
jgi:hypothetical protein